jgi:predicted phosphodiesterase
MWNSMLGLISDIHGNAVALRAVLAELDAMGATEVLCLGDVAGYGPQINECCDLLTERGIPTLMGNHDYYIAFDQPCPRSRSANLCLEYQRSVITPAHKAWLGSHPSHLDTYPGARFAHGGWRDPMDEYMYQLRASYFRELEGELFVSGHTHVQGLWSVGDKTYCNPGSVGQPRDGDARAAFAVLQDGAITLFRTPYDIDEIAEASREAGYDERAYMNLYAGTRVGGAISHVAVCDE